MSAAPTLAPVTPFGQAAEHLKVKLRADLVVQPQFYEGMTHYVIKDPLALKYFRFKIEEYFLLQQFDGKQTLQDVKKAFERKYRPQTISIEDLTRFVAQLHEAGIILIDSPEQAKVLIRRRRKNRWRKVWAFLANILFIKIPIIDPERLLTWMYPYFRWIFTSYFITASVGLMLAAITLVISQWALFYSKLPEFQSFFNWWTIFSFWISLAIVKIIHEFGHGLTAKHFGGEVHEMGMLFLVLTPALYCDVTDSWLLPNKWHRIWISAAGIYVELFLASIATFVWFYSEPGLLNSLTMATMFICSINTVLFNANPLLRYDGYYVMADWLEIPNLRIKSTQFFAYLIQEKVLGLEIPVQSYLPRSRRFLFVTYAIASYVYRWVVTFSIIYFLSQVLKPYKLQSISYMLATGALVPLLGMPVYQIVKFLRTPGRLRKVKKARTAGFTVAAVALVAGILLIPTPLRIQGTLVLTAAKPDEIYAEVEGQLVELNVRDGEWVSKDTVIAKLINPEKQKELVQKQADHAINFAKAQWYNQSPERENRALARQHLQAAEELEPILQKINEQIGKLTLVAARDGQVMGVPHPETVGQVLKPGKPFCEVGDPHHIEAHLIVDQADVDLIRLGRRAWVKIYGRSETTYLSEVSEIAKRSRDEIPPELSHDAGGEIAAKADPKTGVVKPQTAVYEAIIPIENPSLTLQPGLRGFAKIDGGTSTFGWWLWRLYFKTFNFRL
ncbi:MAG: HlyD family efflux transporter periplasmic adaptor subunit [Planctomycetaceae bacterium]|nr:HlyD family efflux transporter periplasmic adaptor subunit [Planctomycetaceae bacterium]MBV8312038.1 HlyD family efflux transporter periplasmic adaptor subunit [Planctomycetaceae bacterium]